MKEQLQCKLRETTLISLLLIYCIATSAIAKNINDEEISNEEIKNKVLIVISSNKHGFWLPEVVQPYLLLEQAGFHIDIASPKGDRGNVRGSFQLSTKERREFKQSSLTKKLEQPIALIQVKTAQYSAVYFAGGAGPMFDLVNSKEVHRITREIYENGGIVSADCHGPAALLNVKLSNGKRLISGRRLTAKANVEEGRWARKNYPFLLENEIVALGGIYTSKAKGQEHVVIDDRLITGQNPNSAIPMAEALIQKLTIK